MEDHWIVKCDLLYLAAWPVLLESIDSNEKNGRIENSRDGKWENRKDFSFLSYVFGWGGKVKELKTLLFGWEEN